MQRDTDTDSEDMDRISLVPSDETDAGEDLFGDNLGRDYQSNPLLDTYETEDEEVAPPLTREQKEAAEREISQAYPSWGMSEAEWPDELSSQTDADPPLGSFPLLHAHIDSPSIRSKIKKEASAFLRTAENRKYLDLINQMASLNTQSLYVDYFDLERFSSPLAQALLSAPAKMLPLLNAGLRSVVRGTFPRYSQIHPVLLFRVANIPTYDRVSDLRNIHLNSLIKVPGIITRRSSVYPMVSLVKYTCGRCSAVVGPFLIESEQDRPRRCLECQSSGSLAVNTEETLYKDYQKLTVQEVPGRVPPGRLPRSKEVVAQYDLIDRAKPGDEVEIVGTYKTAFTRKSHVFSTYIEALSITPSTGGDDLALSPEEEREIARLSRLPNILSLVILSIAPSIHGMYEAKRAIALSLFGGVPKHSPKHKTRGDINTLLLGDPGMAKSQLLKYVEKISPRGIFTTGQGASAVGLTAMVRKDPVSREWMLEGGALVLADKGICLIDEFDKMKETDRVSIHEAMEQQSISISKAGIVTTLQARCSVIAAANPTRGRYNPSYTFSQNVNLTDPIISRFDIICVIKDECLAYLDRELASFIVDTHSSLSSAHSPPIPHELLRKYIFYARERVFPICEIEAERVSSLYAALRRESAAAGGIPITVRHIESVVRISEAAARAHLRDRVEKKDIDLAIRVVLDSFCGTQKVSAKNAILRKFAKYLPSTEEDFKSLLSLLLRVFEAEKDPLQIEVRHFKKKALSLGLKYKQFFLSAEFTSRFYISSCGEHIKRRE